WCVPARSLLRADRSFLQSPHAQRRRSWLCSVDWCGGADLVRSGGGHVQDTRALVPLVLAGHLRGGDHAAVVADSPWDRSNECRAVSACVIRHPESLALRVRAGPLVAVELER